jgi:hypothetical protein
MLLRLNPAQLIAARRHDYDYNKEPTANRNDSPWQTQVIYSHVHLKHRSAPASQWWLVLGNMKRVS